MILIICLGWLAMNSTMLGFSKANSVSLSKKGMCGYLMNVFFTGACAAVVFWAMNGFQLHINLRVVIYALAYGIVCLFSILVNPMLYSCADIVEITIFDKASALILSSLLGVLIFSETFGISSFLQIFLMIAATVCVLLSHPRDKSKTVQKKKVGAKKYFLLLIMALVTTFDTVINRFYVKDPLVTDEQSYFFLTNIVMVVGSAIALAVYAKTNGIEIKTAFSVLEKREYINVLSMTVSSNLSAVLSMAAIARLDMIVYTPVSSAIGIAGSVIVALIFREKLNLFSYLALLFALISLSVVSFMPA